MSSKVYLSMEIYHFILPQLFWWCVIMVWTCHYDLSSSVNSKTVIFPNLSSNLLIFFLINSMLKMLKLLKNFDRINISKTFRAIHTLQYRIFCLKYHVMVLVHTTVWRVNFDSHNVMSLTVYFVVVTHLRQALHVM